MEEKHRLLQSLGKEPQQLEQKSYKSLEDKADVFPQSILRMEKNLSEQIVALTDYLYALVDYWKSTEETDSYYKKRLEEQTIRFEKLKKIDSSIEVCSKHIPTQ